MAIIQSYQSAKKASAAGASALLGGNASVLGASPRLVGKNLAVNSNSSSSTVAQQQPPSAKQEDRGGGDDGNGADGGARSSYSDGVGDEICQVSMSGRSFLLFFKMGGEVCR